VEAVFSQARQQGKPLFLYWGAKWCPPCNQVKATVFTRPDFIALSRKMMAIQLDGDSPGAQRLGEMFKVRGYPTMIVFNPRGDELMRLPGEVDAPQYLLALQTALRSARPLAQVLASAQHGERLSPDDWRRLAWYSWETDTEQLIAAGQDAAVLRQLARACAEQDKAQVNTASTTRLLVKAVLAARDGSVAIDPELRFDAGAALLRLLGDGASARQHTDIVTSYAVKLVEAITAAGSPERGQLVAAWNDASRRLQADASVSRADRLGALNSRVDLAGLGLEKGARKLPPVFLEEVRNFVTAMDRGTTDRNERQAVVIAEADLLENAGLATEADILLKANLSRSHSPYYLMSMLASNARQRGDKQDAIDWSRKAWEASHGPATRIQWGASYLSTLVDYAPEQVEQIELAAVRMVRELSETPDAYYQRNARYVQRIAGKLKQWNAVVQQPGRIEHIAKQWEPACRQLPTEDARRMACEAVFKS
jgi:thiol-disulfide isomerase/thioredoxin